MKQLEKNIRKVNVYSAKKMILIVKQVCENYASGEYTLKSVCKNAGVPYRTYKHWWSMYSKQGSVDGSKWAILAEVAVLWEEAQNISKNIREQELVQCAEQMLFKRVKGYYYEIKETTFQIQNGKYEGIIPIRVKKIEKYAHPSDSLIKFVLTKLCPENYDNLIFKEYSNNDTNSYKDWTMDELDTELEKIKRHE